MACFIVPATEAIVTTVATKIIEKKENAEEAVQSVEEIAAPKVKLSTRLKSLNGFLWGGSALLAFEHLWHGEIQPFAPFLTAAETSDGLTEMLGEMSTVGVGMTVMVTAVWAIGTAVLSRKEKKMLAKERV